MASLLYYFGVLTLAKVSRRDAEAVTREASSRLKPLPQRG
jgi:hypothetical protein